ncbi:hypothetical protein H1R20_g11030, partial [Candolleomyces eurysporus]
MISSTTLILATLVFNAASVLGAPIRIPTAPEVAVRAAVDEPILPRVEIVDVQPEHKRSVDGTSSRPRLAREIAPEHTTREPASPESVEMRDSLPEVEKIVRRYPRRSLFEFYQKRSPEPSPAPSDPAAQLETRSAPAEPELQRRYPRRVYHDYYAKRAEPAPPEARSEAPAPDAPQLQRRYPRRGLAEYYEKRSAPPTDNVRREPSPEPAPEPAPEPVPEPAPEPAPVKPQEQEHHVREVEPPTDYLEKRQEESEGSQTPPEAPPAGETTTTSSASPTATLPGTPLGGATTTSTTTSTTSAATPTSGVPQNLDFNRVIADAIVKGNSNTVHEGPNGKTNSYKDTTIMIKITQQENSDRKLDPVPSSSNAAPTPTSTDKGSAGTGGATATSTSSTSSTASATATPPPSTETPPSGSTGDDSTKPADTGASTPPPDGGEGAAAQESRRDLGEDNAAAQPIKKRTLGLSGALWATWSRRNAMN